MAISFRVSVSAQSGEEFYIFVWHTRTWPQRSSCTPQNQQPLCEWRQAASRALKTRAEESEESDLGGRQLG